MDWEQIFANLHAGDNAAAAGFNPNDDTQALAGTIDSIEGTNIEHDRQLSGMSASSGSSNPFGGLPVSNWSTDPPIASTFAPTMNYHQAAIPGFTQHSLNTVPMATMHYPPPTSAPMTSSYLPAHHQQMQMQPQPMHHFSRHPSPYTTYYTQQDDGNLSDNNIFGDGDDVDEGDASATDPCYAQLLYRCLREAPDHTMSLKDLYEWVKQHSQKARDPENKGWKNSVRHNLSMNAAFERVPASPAKKGSLWRLTNKALNEGVLSTTRFRKDPKRKPERHGAAPAIKRQQSGAKGGQATRNLKRARDAMRSATSSPVGPRRPPFYHSQIAEQPLYSRVSAPFGYHSPQQRLPHTGPATAPSTPYFFDPLDAAPMAPPTSFSNPHTPPQMQLKYEAPQKGYLGEFELQHIDYATQGLFGNGENISPETPSLATEASFFTDDMGSWSAPSQKAESEPVMS